MKLVGDRNLDVPWFIQDVKEDVKKFVWNDRKNDLYKRDVKE